MKKIIILALILLVSCEMIPLGKQGEKTPIEIRKGTEGVVVTLINPNPEIIEQQNIFIIAKLENKGATNVKKGYYNIITGDYINITKEKGKFNLQGKTIYNPKGETKQIEITGTSKKLPKQTEHYTTQIIFQTCYEYETIATPTVCIDTDITNTKPKPCKPETKTLTGGQGGPIEVTKIEPKMLAQEGGVKPAFFIYIKKPKKGIIIKKEDTEKACSGQKQKITLNKINATVKLRDEQLDCRKTEIRLGEKETKIFCTSKETYKKKEGTFNTILNINLTYGYMDTESTNIDITKIA